MACRLEIPSTGVVEVFSRSVASVAGSDRRSRWSPRIGLPGLHRQGAHSSGRARRATKIRRDHISDSPEGMGLQAKHEDHAERCDLRLAREGLVALLAE